MSVGPITIFDKSALELLNVDEACLFGLFYRINLTPIFFVETLADLEKRVAEGRAPERVVGSISGYPECASFGRSRIPGTTSVPLVGCSGLILIQASPRSTTLWSSNVGWPIGQSRRRSGPFSRPVFPISL
jgi:hypothetical protein